MTPEQFRGLVKQWEKSGKTDFLLYVKDILPGRSESLLNAVDTCEDPRSALYRLILAGSDGTLRKENVAKTLSELSSYHPDLPAVIVDIFNLLEVELSVSDEAKQKERLYWIIKAVEVAVSNPLLRERMEVESFPHIGVVKNPKAFNSKFIKLKTKLYYKQRKFNLLREESEGYAKLLVELNQASEDGGTTPEHMLETIKSIIGCFNLDPNRVLDVLLSALECSPQRHGFLVPLLRLYMPRSATIGEMLGIKYNFSRTSNASPVTTTTTSASAAGPSPAGEASSSTAAAATKTDAGDRMEVDGDEGGDATPKSLHVMTALLLRHAVIQLDDIWPWLTPADDVITGHFKKLLSSAMEFQRRTFVVSTKDKEDNPSEEDPIEPLSMAQNQKLGLCEAALSIGDWTTAEKILALFPDHAVTCHQPISVAACRLIHVRIDPIYRRHTLLTSKLKPAPFAVPALFEVRDDDELTEFRTEVAPLLFALGPHVHADVSLVHKVLRVASAAHHQRCLVSNPDSDENREEFLYYDVLSVLEDSILPALLLMDANCCLAEQIWTVLQYYPYQHRYRLYGTWKNDSHSRQPQLIRQRARLIKMSKSLMKRISKENVKPIGRLMGKVTHSAPGYMFEYMLGQIQIYDNLIGPMVDSLKYLTNLSYDVLGYCIIEALANPEKDRTKHDGTSLSLWLTSLANFCGAIFKKYNLDLTGLMQYVANQLKAMKSLDLLILREVVQKMAGVEAVEDMTEDQLAAMAGGELLRAEAGFFNQVRNTKKSSQRLKDSLIENNLMIPMVLLMAQQRHCVIFKETEGSHLKLVGKLYDQCQDTMVQFGMFLSSALSIDDYRQRLPSFDRLLSEFHISADVAFFLARPMFTHNIQQRYDELRKAEKGHKSMPLEQRRDKYIQACEEVLVTVSAAVMPAYPARTWDDISGGFFTSFWTLTLHDLHVPSDSYDKETRRLKQQLTQFGDNRDLTDSKRKKEQERCQLLIDKLHEEEKRQKEHVDRVLARLTKEKDSWFEPRQAKSAKAETMTQLVQLCLFPRCVFTSMDALYCAQLVHTLHKLRTPNFSTLICYDRLFCNITYTFTSCTENEASRYGRFLCALLQTVMRWHSSGDIFEAECSMYPGFVTKFRVSNKQNERSDHVGYENYRHVCFKWYYKITKALITCLDSGDYVQIRNALIILIKILSIYPILSHVANIIEKKVEVVIVAEKNKRQDLCLMATSYVGLLRAKKHTYIGEKDFHSVDKTKKPAATAAPASADKPVSSATAASSSRPSSSGSGPDPGIQSTTTAASPVTNGVRSRAETKRDATVGDHSTVGGDSSSHAANNTLLSNDVHEHDVKPRPHVKHSDSLSPPGGSYSERAGSQSLRDSRLEDRWEKRSSSSKRHSADHSEASKKSRRSERDPDEIRVVEDEFFERPRPPPAVPTAAADAAAAAVSSVSSNSSAAASPSRGSPVASSRSVYATGGAAAELTPADRESKRRRTECKRVDKPVEKDDEKKKKRKKVEKGLEDGEIRPREKKDRKRGLGEMRMSPSESKRKKDDEKTVKQRRSADDPRETKEKHSRASVRYEPIDDYDDTTRYSSERYEDEVDWEREQPRHASKDKHRSSRSADGKRR